VYTSTKITRPLPEIVSFCFAKTKLLPAALCCAAACAVAAPLLCCVSPARELAQLLLLLTWEAVHQGQGLQALIAKSRIPPGLLPCSCSSAAAGRLSRALLRWPAELLRHQTRMPCPPAARAVAAPSAARAVIPLRLAPKASACRSSAQHPDLVPAQNNQPKENQEQQPKSNKGDRKTRQNQNPGGHKEERASFPIQS